MQCEGWGIAFRQTAAKRAVKGTVKGVLKCGCLWLGRFLRTIEVPSCDDYQRAATDATPLSLFLYH